MTQITDTILMVRPAAFGYNAETAVNNYFQNAPTEQEQNLQARALSEFNTMVSMLRSNSINVLVVDDTLHPPKPDAIFPNNWFNTTEEGVLNIFPMFAKNRREEKRDDILKKIAIDFELSNVYDWTEYEAEAQFLEGTGSMVIDHVNKILYACVSPRTHYTLIEKFAATNGYRAMAFTAADENGPVYHTNVMLCIGETFAVLCPKIITDDTERIAVAQLLETTGHENIYIEAEQMKQFAGNMLQVKNKNDERFIVLSQSAYNSLNNSQRQRLQQHGTLLPIAVPTIEAAAGGSVRCMMAEVFLAPKA